MRWSIFGVLLGSLAVSSCGTTHAQEPRRSRYVMGRPAAGANQLMVMWVLDTQTGEVVAYTVEPESGRQSVLDRLDIVRLVQRQ